MSPMWSQLIVDLPIILTLIAVVVACSRAPQCERCNDTEEAAFIDFATGEGVIIPCPHCVHEPRPTVPVRATRRRTDV